jgi:hypothetical protein
METRTTNEILESIDTALWDMNILQAMKMMHDTSRNYSDREMELLNSFAEIPFGDEDGNPDDEDGDEGNGYPTEAKN